MWDEVNKQANYHAPPGSRGELAVFTADAGQRMTELRDRGRLQRHHPRRHLQRRHLLQRDLFKDDGSIRYHDVNGSDSGEWSVKDDTFCTFYESQQGACFFVERDGKNCFTFFEARGDQNGPPPPSTWTSRGWNRESKSTCPTPPGAEI